MKLGLLTAAFPRMRLERVASWASDNGFEMLEVACWPAAGGERRRYVGVSHIDAANLDVCPALAQHRAGVRESSQSPTEEAPMSVAKVIEITASSPTSFAEAAKAGIAKASETIHGIKGAWISEESVVVENDQVTEFRVTMRVSFVLD
jgi:dodecin